MKKYPKRVLLVNTFGTLGYLLCIILWAWIGILYTPMIFENEQIEHLLLPTPDKNPAPTPSSIPMSPLVIALALVVTAIIMIITIVVVLRAPIGIAKAGRTVTTKAADSAIPLITRGHPLPPAEKQLLAAGLIKLVKLLLLLLPVAVAAASWFVQLPLPFGVVMLVAGTLALLSLFWFSLQYIFAQLLGVAAKQLV